MKDGIQIQATAIRLSQDEARTILAAANSGGKPITRYGQAALAELGLMEKVIVKHLAAKQGEEKAAWSELVQAARAKDYSRAYKAFDLIQCARKEKEHTYGYVLTELGKEVARGLTVKMVTK